MQSQNEYHKKIAILQSNYIPWKGYFDIINSVDEFIIYDQMQYTRRDWRNRNIIKTPNGTIWLTIPVENKGKYFQKIRDTKVVSPDWASKHWNTIKMSYSKAPYFKEYKSLFQDLYAQASNLEYLSDINYLFIKNICDILGIKTKLSYDTDYGLVEGKTERLVGLVLSAGGDYYLSGPAAKDYIVDEVFQNAKVTLEYMDYSNYPEYEQLYGEYNSNVSILDLIFMAGPDASKYMKSF